MTEIGIINNRQIFYINIRTDLEWYTKLPSTNWLAFTIADLKDQNLLNDLSLKCLDANVSYVCCVGQLASLTDDYFDEEIVRRQVEIEKRTGKPQDYETTTMTTFHSNFDEGFWFAIYSAFATVYEEYIPIQKIVCLDLTEQGVKKYLLLLTEKMKTDWLPPDEEIVIPKYDND